MTDDDLRRRATEAGLDLTPEQLAQLARATALARRLADLVPHDPLPAEEPALVLRLRRKDRQ
jgi:hypothetical protein